MDPLEDVFNSEALQRLDRRRDASAALAQRLRVLRARGSDFHVPQREAWSVYLKAAQAVGLLDDDLTARLRNADDDQFRGAMAECCAAWVLAGKLKLAVSPRPSGRGKRVLELAIRSETGEIGVEVKAPLVAAPANGAGWVSYEEPIRRNLEAANEKFSPDCPNLVVLVPDVWVRIHQHRELLLGPLVGSTAISIDMDSRDRETRTEFVPRGSLVRRVKPDGSPAFRRVSGIMAIEEIVDTNRRDRLGHVVLVVHNPIPLHKLPTDLWGDAVQFRQFGNLWKWSDGGLIL